MEQKSTSEATTSDGLNYQWPYGLLQPGESIHPPTPIAQTPQKVAPTHLHPPTSTLLKALLAAILTGGVVTFLDWSVEDWKPTLAGAVGGATALAVVAIENRNGRIAKQLLRREIRRIAKTASAEELVGLVELERSITDGE